MRLFHGDRWPAWAWNPKRLSNREGMVCDRRVGRDRRARAASGFERLAMLGHGIFAAAAGIGPSVDNSRQGTLNRAGIGIFDSTDGKLEDLAQWVAPVVGRTLT
jgi:hypothetical protein